MSTNKLSARLQDQSRSQKVTKGISPVMSTITSVENRLHALLQQILGPTVSKLDNRDSYYFTYGSVVILITIVSTQDGVPLVKVASPILVDTQKSAKLLDALNDMNGGMEVGRAYWMDGYVWAATTMVAETLDRQELEQAIDVVGKWADTVDEAFASAFGGTMPNAPTHPASPSARPSA